jgi:hypothetical protein
MPSHDRRAAGRRRAWGRGPIILRFEPLEGRRLPTASPLPDLVGSSIATTSVADWGDSIEVKADILNQGRGMVSTPFNVAIYAMASPNIGAKSVLLAEVPITTALAPGQSATIDKTLNLPASPIPNYSGSGAIYIGLKIDPEKAVDETNRNNDQGVGAGYDTAAVQVAPKPHANLVGNALNVVPIQADPSLPAPTAATWGGAIQVTAQVVNSSQGDAPPTRAAITLTPAGQIPGDGQDVTIGYLNIPAVPAWQTVNVSQPITLPAVAPSMLAGGTGFTLSMIQDADYSTDIRYPHGASQGAGKDMIAVTINPGLGLQAPAAPQPDLAAGGVQVVGSPIFWGHTFQVNGTIQNLGAGDAGPFRADLFLIGTDGSLANGLFLGEVNFDGLKSVTSQSFNATLQLPSRLPAGMTIEGASVGRVAMIVNPDNMVDEGGKLSNNASESNPVTLRLLGSDGSSNVPTAPAVTTTPPPLGRARTAGTLQTAPHKKAPLTGPGGRSVPLHRHIVANTHNDTLSQLAHNLSIFPRETNNLFKSLVNFHHTPKVKPRTKTSK